MGKVYIFPIIVCLWGIFIYWVSGGEFVRGKDLSNMLFSVSICAAIGACLGYVLDENEY
jgi:ABC-type xylose transport system permease subunit